MNRKKKYRISAKGKACVARYRQTKMGKLMLRLQQYRLRGTFIDCSREDLIRILDAFEGRCAYCGADVSTLLYFDHVVALKKDGPTVPANVVPCCRPCNEHKNACNIIDLIQSKRGRLQLFGRVLAHCMSERGSELVVPLLETQLENAVCDEVNF